MINQQQYVSDLSTFITKLSQKTYNRLENQNIVTGVILESCPGYYKVQINNSDTNEQNIKKAVAIIGHYLIGESVFLIKTQVSNGDVFDSSYYIIGKINNEETFNEKDLENYLDTYFFVSGLAIPVFIGEIFKEDYVDLFNKIADNGCFQVEGFFNANENKDNFGLKITFIYSADRTDYEIFYFDKQSFTGQPHKLSSSHQLKKFITKNKGKEIYSIVIDKINPDDQITNIAIGAGIIEFKNTNLFVKVNPLQNKDYIFMSSDEIRLEAELYYQQQILNSNDIQYFWYIKDKESAEVLPHVGSGWKILNISTQEQVLGKSFSVEEVYETENNYFELNNSNSESILKSFKNILKCVAIYKNFSILSEDIIIYNYLKEDINATLQADKEENLLVIPDQDETKAKVIIENNNEYALKDMEIVYEWFGKTDNEEAFLIITTDNTKNIYTNSSKLNFDNTDNKLNKGLSNVTIVSAVRDKELDNNKDFIYVNSEFREFQIFCKVFLFNVITKQTTLIAETNIITIKSYVKEWQKGTINPLVKYQYWISKSSTTNFIYKETEPACYLPENDADIVKTGICMSSFEELYDNNILKDIKGQLNVNTEYFIFYSAQTQYTVEADIEIVKGLDTFTVPEIARTIMKNKNQEILNFRNAKEIAQLNNFNQLTRNGVSQGVFYTTEEYQKTLDIEPKQETTYYVTNLVYVPQQAKPNQNLTYFIYDDQSKTYQEVKKLEESFEDNVDYYIQNPKNQEDYLKLTIRDSWVADTDYYIYNNNDYQIIDKSQGFDPTVIYYREAQDGYRAADENNDFDKDINEGQEILKFKNNTIYYEKQKAGDLYINASYINTGTLRIGKEDEEIFYANIDANNSEVKIAGFMVDNQTFQSLDTRVGISSNFNKPAFWAGEKNNETNLYPFQVDHNGSLNATSGEIAGYEISSLSLKSDLKSGEGEDQTIQSIGMGSSTNDSNTIAFWAGTKSDADNNYTFQVKQSGEIFATAGKIGNLNIHNDGLVCYNFNDEEGILEQMYSLNSSGLQILNPLASIEVGNFKLQYASNCTYLIATGPVQLQSGPLNEPIAYLKFGSDEGASDTEDIKTYNIYLKARTATSDWNNYVEYYLYAKNSDGTDIEGGLPITFSQDIYYQTSTWGYSYSKGSGITKVTLRIPAKQTESEHKGHWEAWTLWDRWFCISLNPSELNRSNAAGTAPGGYFSSSCYEVCMRWTNGYNHEIDSQIGEINMSPSTNNFLFNGNLVLDGNYTGNIGSSDKYWTAVFADSLYGQLAESQTASIITDSDFNKKYNIQKLSNNYSILFDKLKPVSYQYVNNNSNRNHTGLIAQEVKQAIEESNLTTQNFAGYCEWEDKNGIITCGLRYEEFIALCIYEIQKLKKEIKEIKEKKEIE